MNIKHFPRKIKRRIYMINIKKNILLVYIWDTKHNTGISWYILHEWWIQILVNIYTCSTCIVYKNFQQHLRWPQKLYRSSTLMIMQHITEVNKSTYLHDHSKTCTVHVTNLPYINCFHFTIMRCDIHQCSYVLKLCLPINSISQIG